MQFVERTARRYFERSAQWLLAARRSSAAPPHPGPLRQIVRDTAVVKWMTSRANNSAERGQCQGFVLASGKTLRLRSLSPGSSARGGVPLPHDVVADDDREETAGVRGPMRSSVYWKTPPAPNPFCRAYQAVQGNGTIGAFEAYRSCRLSDPTCKFDVAPRDVGCLTVFNGPV